MLLSKLAIIITNIVNDVEPDFTKCYMSLEQPSNQSINQSDLREVYSLSSSSLQQGLAAFTLVLFTSFPSDFRDNV